MTLEEAIKHCEEKAEGCDECSKEHQQLAEWLRELKFYKQLGGIDDIRTDKEHIRKMAQRLKNFEQKILG